MQPSCANIFTIIVETSSKVMRYINKQGMILVMLGVIATVANSARLSHVGGSSLASGISAKRHHEDRVLAEMSTPFTIYNNMGIT